VVVGVDWGSFPAWVATIGTLAALFFGTNAFVRDLRDRREHRADERAAQARLIDAWVDGIDRLPEKDREGFAAISILIKVANTSSQAVRDCMLNLKVFDAPSGNVPLGVVPPRSPGNERVFPIRWDLSASKQGLARVDPFADFQVESFRFTDTLGNRWARAQDGSLRFIHNVDDHKREMELVRKRSWKRVGPPTGSDTD
jgi:hypothetical protein